MKQTNFNCECLFGFDIHLSIFEIFGLLPQSFHGKKSHVIKSFYFH